MNDNLNNNRLGDVIWYEDINILFRKNLLTEYFPTPDMTLNEKFNSVVRLSLYLSIILICYSGKVNYVFILIFCMLFTFLVKSFRKSNIDEKFNSDLNNEKTYVKPTFDNPFMNIQYDDYVKQPNRESLSKKYVGNTEKTKDIDLEIEEKFNYNLYKDMSDIFNKNNSQRQFYTNPITTIPNDQHSFANWLYNNGPTCKEKFYKKCEYLNYNNLKQSSLYR